MIAGNESRYAAAHLDATTDCLISSLCSQVFKMLVRNKILFEGEYCYSLCISVVESIFLKASTIRSGLCVCVSEA